MSIAEIEKELNELANAETATFLQKFFKTGRGEYGAGDLFRGVRVPVLRKLAAKYQNISLAESKRLLQSQFHEDRLLALFFMVRLFAKSNEAARKDIYRLYLNNARFINNWDLVDSSAEHIVGAYLNDKNRAPLHRLAESANLWKRRIAVMATFHFIKHGDFNETLTIAEKLLTDKEDLIHKATGWMLREVGNRDLKAEKTFINQYYRKMPRTMLRYAVEKFPEAERQKYIKGEV
ncbi:MAG: DNA alkylation repair protein [Verrucomicrobiota bacterium]|nr:DNA alkylation repair protein [Verrucomicrobiota bacterium]